MAATNELKRVAREAEAAASGIQAALDRAERVMDYAIAHSLATELTGLAAGEIIDSNINKERCVDSTALLANLIYYLRGRASGGNTVAGAAPLNAASLKTLTDKLGL